MSQNNKLNLWQKLKLLLTTAAPQSVIDATDNSFQASSSTTNDKERESLDKNNADGPSHTDHKDNAIKASTDSITHTVHNVLDGKTAAIQTPIIDYLKQYFHKHQWHYTHYRPRANDSQQLHHLSLRIRNKKINYGYLFRVQEGNSLLAVYGILPFLIPESHKSAAMLLITQINYDMLIGNLEMDIADGEIRYKNALDIEAVGMRDDIIEHLLQSVIAMTTVAHEIFSDLVNTQNPSTDISILLNELRQQADARTFFLPTQKMQ